MDMPTSERTPATWRMAGWKVLAKAKPRPEVRTVSATCSGGAAMGTPTTSSRSKLPEVDEALTLPCLQTVAPAPAATKQAIVEMFNAWALRPAVPPVPTMSMAPAGMSRGAAASRMAFASPSSSPTAGPLSRRATMNAATCASVASPARMSPRAARASPGPMSRPAASVASTPGHPP